ncbi:MAG: rod-binding protein [Schwartzia sp.]|nr:rod-binding protein [Schwartzia sp. (in: firmicutes)]
MDPLGGISPISPIHGGTTTYESAQERARAARFDEILNQLREKAAAAGSTGPTTDSKEAQATDKKLREACEGFEAMLLNIMYKEMRNTVPKDTLFGEDNGKKIWQSMLDTELMQAAAKSGGIGLADMLYQQLAPQVLAQQQGQVPAAGQTNPAS